MPYTSPVNSLQSAWDIVRNVDEPNCGLLLDTWHRGRTDGNMEALQNIPPERITSIQLSDILAVPHSDMHDGSLHYRQVLGEGTFNLVDFLQLVDEYFKYARQLYDGGYSIDQITTLLTKQGLKPNQIKILLFTFQRSLQQRPRSLGSP